jgi:hypothetical protein
MNEIISSNNQSKARIATKKNVTMATQNLNKASGESICPERRFAAPTPVMIAPTIKSEILKR